MRLAGSMLIVPNVDFLSGGPRIPVLETTGNPCNSAATSKWIILDIKSGADSREQPEDSGDRKRNWLQGSPAGWTQYCLVEPEDRQEVGVCLCLPSQALPCHLNLPSPRLARTLSAKRWVLYSISLYEILTVPSTIVVVGSLTHLLEEPTFNFDCEVADLLVKT